MRILKTSANDPDMILNCALTQKCGKIPTCEIKDTHYY